MVDERPRRRSAGPPEPVRGGLADHLSDAVYVVDTQRRITYWNDAAERLTGYPAGDVIGRRCGATLLAHVALDGTPLCGPRCPLDATIRDGQDRQLHASLHTRADEVVPVHIRASALWQDGRVAGAVEVFSDETAARDAQRVIAELEALVLQDPLTGVGNRRALERAFAQHALTAAETGSTFGLLVLDLDGFKEVNDRYGHATGDLVLRHFAQCVHRAIRPHDTVARLGGDEFAVVTGVVSESELEGLVTRVCHLATGTPASSGPHEVDVAVSVGTALVAPGEPAEVALARADAALYAHKARRRRTMTETVSRSAP